MIRRYNDTPFTIVAKFDGQTMDEFIEYLLDNKKELLFSDQFENMIGPTGSYYFSDRLREEDNILLNNLYDNHTKVSVNVKEIQNIIDYLVEYYKKNHEHFLHDFTEGSHATGLTIVSSDNTLFPILAPYLNDKSII